MPNSISLLLEKLRSTKLVPTGNSESGDRFIMSFQGRSLCELGEVEVLDKLELPWALTLALLRPLATHLI